MKIKQTFISLAICLVCTAPSCKKEKDDLPKDTEEGKNTFGCKIDGKLFIPKDVVTFPVTPGLSSYYDEGEKWLHLSATEPKNEDGLQRNLTIDVKNISIGNNPLNSNLNKAVIIFHQSSQQDQYYETKDTNGGTVTISRLDTVANVISGTFSFQATPRFNENRTVSVANGRFDITYKP